MLLQTQLDIAQEALKVTPTGLAGYGLAVLVLVAVIVYQYYFFRTQIKEMGIGHATYLGAAETRYKQLSDYSQHKDQEIMKLEIETIQFLGKLSTRLDDQKNDGELLRENLRVTKDLVEKINNLVGRIDTILTRKHE